MELGKSVSQPPVPNPTWPNASRWAKPAALNEALLLGSLRQHELREAAEKSLKPALYSNRSFRA